MLQTSEETTRKQAEVARVQGDAQQRAIEAMVQETGGHSGRKRAGDYLVAYAIEEAEGLYEWREGQLTWQPPTSENAHVEVVVCDPADGRFIAGLPVTVTLATEEGVTVASHEQPMLWHPWLSHYGRNWTVPGTGNYTLRIDIDPLPLARHDKANGHRFAERVTVEFSDVRIETGKKRS